MSKWYFQIKNFKAIPGYKFEFTDGPLDRKYKHLCEVIEVDDPNKLSYNWRYDGYEGNSLVSFQLTQDSDRTHLKLTHSGLESFAHIGSDFQIKSFNEGWIYIIDKKLKSYVEGK